MPTYINTCIHTYLLTYSGPTFQVEMSPSGGGTAPNSPRSKDLHDIQFMLCELQKFLHQGQSLRDYAGPQCSWALVRAMALFDKRVSLKPGGPVLCGNAGVSSK